MSKWISVKDRFPDEKMKVLLFTIYGYEIGYYRKKYNDFICQTYYVNTPIDGITHWMPFPDQPEDE